MLRRVLYVSQETQPFCPSEVAALAARASEVNAGQDVTGVLIHARGEFMQFLEGPVEGIRSVLERITADPRHTAIVFLLDEPGRYRLFEAWNMGALPSAPPDATDPANAAAIDPELAITVETGPDNIIFGMLRRFAERGAIPRRNPTRQHAA